MTDKSILIKNLDPRVTEDELKGIFALISPIAHVKITKNNSSNVSFFLIKKRKVRACLVLVIFSHLSSFCATI
jgi:RNA recognition motif-containing protein